MWVSQFYARKLFKTLAPSPAIKLYMCICHIHSANSLRMRAAFSQGMTNLQLYEERPKENLNICNYLNKCHQSKLVGITQDYKEKCTLYLFKN